MTGRRRGRVPFLLPLLVGGPLLLAGIGFASGCSSSSAQGPSPGVPDTQPEIAETHKARCGNCHVRVEPGTRTRAQLEVAFIRHRARVHLTPGEWASMIDYLATRSGE